MSNNDNWVIREFTARREVITHSINVFVLTYEVIKMLPPGYLSLDEIRDLLFASMFHDLGKITWPGDWYTLPKNLITQGDWETMKRHPLISAKVLQQKIGISADTLNIILQHHERPGGNGYPNCTEPDLPSIILAACDVFSACSEVRHYRQHPLNLEDIMQQISFAPPEIIEAIVYCSSPSKLL